MVTPALRYTSLATASAAASTLESTPAESQTVTASRRGATPSAAYAVAKERNSIAIVKSVAGNRREADMV
jgi:hypothetical protein